MVVEFRLYRRFDADLIALCRASYPVSSMMREAVMGYANGRPVHYYIDELTDFDLNDDKTVRSRFVVPNSDYKTCNMLKKVKYRCRNAFVKTVLRNSLIQQNITCFFVDDSLNYLKNVNDNFKNVYAFPNVTSCSTIKTAPHAVAVADGIYVSSDNRTRRMKKRSETEQGYMFEQSHVSGVNQFPDAMQTPYDENYQQRQPHSPYMQNNRNNNGYQQRYIHQGSQQYNQKPVYDNTVQYQMPPVTQMLQYNTPVQPSVMTSVMHQTHPMDSNAQQYAPAPPARGQSVQHEQQVLPQYQGLQQPAYSTQQILPSQGYAPSPLSQSADYNINNVNMVQNAVNADETSDAYTQNTEASDAYNEPVNKIDTSTNIGLADNQQLMNLFDSL